MGAGAAKGMGHYRRVGWGLGKGVRVTRGVGVISNSFQMPRQAGKRIYSISTNVATAVGFLVIIQSIRRSLKAQVEQGPQVLPRRQI